MNVPVASFKLVRRRSLGQISGGSALLDAISNGKVHLAKFILAAIDQKDIVDTKDFQGKTPLIRANYIRDEKIRKKAVELLLWHGAHVNIQDRTGRTALSYACQMQRNDVIKLLVKCNVDPDLADYLGNTPLINAVKANNDVGVGILLRCFKRLGLGVNRKNLEGKTALDIAESMGFKDCAKLLIQVGKAGTLSSDDTGVSSGQTGFGMSGKSSKKYGNEKKLSTNKGVVLRGFSISMENYGKPKKGNKLPSNQFNQTSQLSTSSAAGTDETSPSRLDDLASSGDDDSASSVSSFAIDDIPISADELAREKELVDLLILGRGAHGVESPDYGCAIMASGSPSTLIKRSMSLPTPSASTQVYLSVELQDKRVTCANKLLSNPSAETRERKKSHDSRMNHNAAATRPQSSIPPQNSINAKSLHKTSTELKPTISVIRTPSNISRSENHSSQKPNLKIAETPGSPNLADDTEKCAKSDGSEIPNKLHHKRIKKISAFNNVKLLTSKITSSSSNKMAAIGMKLYDTRLEDEVIDVNKYKNSPGQSDEAITKGLNKQISNVGKERDENNKIPSKLKGSLLSLKPSSIIEKYFRK